MGKVKGYRLSMADKMQDEKFESLMFEQVNLLLKQARRKSGEGNSSATWNKSPQSTSRRSRFHIESSAVADKEILMSSLSSLRVSAGRSDHLDEMSPEQLLQEKVDMQEQLQQYEALHGLQDSQANRDIMADVYDRYRYLLRLTKRQSTPRCSVTNITLDSIPEDSQLDISGTSKKKKEVSFEISPTKKEKWEELPMVKLFKETSDEQESTATDELSDDDYHTMTQTELHSLLINKREEKKRVKKEMKMVEKTFKQENGRSISKEERESLQLYKMYKEIKPKIRLIDALLCKYATIPFHQ